MMSLCVRMYRGLAACPPSAPHLERLIGLLEQVAHPSHYVTLQAKLRLVMLPDTPAEPAAMARQLQLCEEVLAVLDTVEPGLTRRRGQVLRVLALTKLRLLRLQPPAGLELVKQMKQTMAVLKEVSRCKQFDSKADREDWANTLKQTMMMCVANS